MSNDASLKQRLVETGSRHKIFSPALLTAALFGVAVLLLVPSMALATDPVPLPCDPVDCPPVPIELPGCPTCEPGPAPGGPIE
jgi:hypothetical protein